MAKETIKAKVIAMVKNDPFLTIEEIATDAETTPRYVRTILSEAQLSLLELRKRYAKSMEQQLNFTRKDAPVKDYDPHLKLEKVRSLEIASLLNQEEDFELLRISKLQYLQRIPAFCELTTYLDIELRLEAMAGSLRELLLAKTGIKKIDLKQSWVEVVIDNSNLSILLTKQVNQPLLKLSYLLASDEKPIAVETQWLPTEGILLRNAGGSFEISAEIL